MVDDPPNPIFCAVDTAELGRATTLISHLRGVIGGLKLGLEFFTAQGPVGVRQVRAGMPLFLDLKLHDIPNTVGRAITSCTELKPDLMTVHAQGGAEMMRAAVAAESRTATRSIGRLSSNASWSTSPPFAACMSPPEW